MKSQLNCTGGLTYLGTSDCNTKFVTEVGTIWVICASSLLAFLLNNRFHFRKKKSQVKTQCLLPAHTLSILVKLPFPVWLQDPV